MEKESVLRVESFQPNNLSSRVTTILHVDDEPDILEITRIYLDKLSDGKIKVDSLNNPLEVIERISGNTYDVIVCDYKMPEMNGIQLLEKLIVEHQADIPFIIFTGQGREEVAISALNLGAKRYIKKDIDIKSQYEELLHAINEVVNFKRIEEALKKSERERSAILNSMTDLVVYFEDPDLAVVWANEAAAKTVNLTTDQLVGKKYHELWHPRKAADESCPIIKAFQTEKPENAEITTSDGKTWMARGYPVKDTVGNVKGIVSVRRDITDLKIAEKSLKESEHYLKEAQKIAHIGYWTLDPVTEEVGGSDELFRIFGLTREEATLQQFAAVVHPDDLEYDLYHIRRGMEHGIPWDIEHRLICRDGTLKHVHAKGEAITDGNGNVIKVLGTAQDITERKQIEKVMREQQEFSDSMIDALTDTFYVFDPENGKAIRWNKAFAELSGYSNEEMKNNTPLNYYPPEEHQRIEEATRMLMEKGRQIAELTFITKDGKQVPFEYSAVRIESPEGKPLICVIGRDLSQREKEEI